MKKKENRRNICMLLQGSPPASALLEEWISHCDGNIAVGKANSDKQAEDMIAKTHFDLVLVDLGEDQETGIRLLMSVSPRIPCAAIGNDGETAVMAQAWQAGAEKWLQWSPERNAVASSCADLQAMVDGVRKTADFKAEIQYFTEQLALATQVKTTERMARVIAHEYNNLLSGITGNLTLLQMHLPDNEKVGKYGDRMIASVTRLTELSARLSAYAKGNLYQPEKIQPNQFVENLLPLFRRIAGVESEIVFRPNEEAHPFTADSMQLGLVLQEIFQNAVVSAGKVGNITIDIRQRMVSEEEAGMSGHWRPGEYTCLFIRQESSGVDTETRVIPLSPSFSKASGEGGFALASAVQILKAHGGWLCVCDSDSKEMAFEVGIPALLSKE